MYFADPGTQFLSDQIQGYVVAATSELPCPSCLVGLMQIEGDEFIALVEFDRFRCGSCEKRVLIEKVAR